MPSKQINARDLIVQVQNADNSWTIPGLTGLTTASVDWSANEETADTTTYDSAGAYEQEIMQRGASLKLEGKKKQDTITGVYDTAQARLDTLATQVGASSQGAIRFRYPQENTWRNWVCTVSRGEEGGGNNDKTGYSYTITRSGAQTLTAAP